MPLIILVLIVLAVFVLSGQDDGDSEQPPLPKPQTTEVPTGTQRTLAERFRPILLFDSRESWRPLKIKPFFDEAHSQRHALCRRNPDPQGCQKISGHEDFVDRLSGSPEGGKDLYIDISGDAVNGTHSVGPDLACPGRAGGALDCNEGPSTAIYYDVKQANGRYYVDYWWFFRYNDYRQFKAITHCDWDHRAYCGDHEGDWEGVTVVTAADRPREIEYVVYAEHSGNFRYAISQISKGPSASGRRDTRPWVYVADGTHASYPRPCSGLYCPQLFPLLPALKQLGLRIPEGRHNGALEWGRNDAACGEERPPCLIHLPDPEAGSWNAFSGQWGKFCAVIGQQCAVNEGPDSPSNQFRNQNPWCFLRVLPSGDGFEEARSCDAETPGTGPAAAPEAANGTDCRAWAGAGVAILACDQAQLAASLATETTADSSGIAIQLEDGTVGKTVTRGVAQVVAKPLRAPYRFIVRGKVTEVLVRARAPNESLIEAKFANLQLAQDDEVAVELRQREGRVNVFMQLPDGTYIEPTPPTQLG